MNTRSALVLCVFACALCAPSQAGAHSEWQKHIAIQTVEIKKVRQTVFLKCPEGFQPVSAAPADLPDGMWVEEAEFEDLVLAGQEHLALSILWLEGGTASVTFVLHCKRLARHTHVEDKRVRITPIRPSRTRPISKTLTVGAQAVNCPKRTGPVSYVASGVQPGGPTVIGGAPGAPHPTGYRLRSVIPRRGGFDVDLDRPFDISSVANLKQHPRFTALCARDPAKAFFLYRAAGGDEFARRIITNDLSVGATSFAGQVEPQTNTESQTQCPKGAIATGAGFTILSPDVIAGFPRASGRRVTLPFTNLSGTRQNVQVHTICLQPRRWRKARR